MATGTMNPANPTVPWVAWDEDTRQPITQVFVSRLVGAGAAARFVPVNNGQPISAAGVDATRPDITFSGNTPYVTWRTDSGGSATTTASGTSSTRPIRRSWWTRAARPDHAARRSGRRA